MALLVFVIRKIVEEHLAEGSIFVPAEHSFDTLAQLGVVGLIDTAGVDPDPVKAFVTGDAAAFNDLGVACLQNELEWR